jgi:hypothetical protein
MLLAGKISAGLQGGAGASVGTNGDGHPGSIDVNTWERCIAIVNTLLAWRWGWETALHMGGHISSLDEDARMGDAMGTQGCHMVGRLLLLLVGREVRCRV